MNPPTQLDEAGRLRHLLTLEGLPASFYRDLFARAESFLDPDTGGIAKAPLLRDKLVVNAFFEPSTRTRMAFEIAAKSLSAEVVNFDTANSSAAAKGETMLDTFLTIAALGADIVVVRHSQEGLVAKLALEMPAGVALVNSGDGSLSHPSQGLLDVWTIARRKGHVEDLKVAIIGDILHSRVARSLVHAFNALATREVVVSGPARLVPVSLEQWGVAVEHDVDKAVADADVIICLRFQYERMAGGMKEASGPAGASCIIDARRLALAKPEAMVMHPGPINRDVEISAEVADGPQSCILEQVTNGVAMRMALLATLSGR